MTPPTSSGKVNVQDLSFSAHKTVPTLTPTPKPPEKPVDGKVTPPNIR